MKSYKLHAVVSLVSLFVAPALMAETLFDRGLPTTNLNNAAGVNRSNVTWAFPTPYGTGVSYNYAVGDDFNLGKTGNYDISTLRLWVTSTDSQPLSAMWSNFTLFGGVESSSTVNALSTVNTTGSDPNVTFTQVHYTDSTSYQGSSGNFISLWQVDFNLNWIVDGQTTYQFFLGGTPVGNNVNSPFLHSSNDALSGSFQQGADDKLRYFGWNNDFTDIGAGPWTSLGDGWDKASDVNIQLYGAAVPLPPTVWGGLALLTGLFARKGLRKISAK